jgi:hypothetical protein
VDYNWLDPLQEESDDRVQVLHQHCEVLGMDCSVFVLSHNDLGPTNIIINGDRIAVLDWEMAGYCPLGWVRTKFAICGALCVERVSSAGVEVDGEYRTRVEQKLGEMGFPDVTAAYKDMMTARKEEWTRNQP